MIPLSLAENVALETMGLLRPKQGALLADPRLAKLTEPERMLLLTVFSFGEGGMPRGKIRVRLKPSAETLYIMDYVNWERDGRGRPAYLVLTWKGEEAAAALKATLTVDEGAR